MFLLKVSFTTCFVCIGIILSRINFEIKTVFKSVVVSELVFVIAQVIYVFNLFNHQGSLILNELSNHYPLTLLSYYGTENVVKWLEYPLKTLNIFEIVYILSIAWLLAKQWKKNFTESLVVVLPSYVMGLILWLVLVTFLTLQVS